MQGVETVYHCAATFAKTDPAASHRVNVAGTERVARAAATAGVRRFVYVSSASIYAATPRLDRTFGEEVEPQRLHRLNHYSRTKYEGELAVRRVACELGLSWVILRPTNVYGRRSGPWFRQWERRLTIVPLAIGHTPIDLVYVDDVVEVMVMAAAASAAGGEVFNVGHEMVPMNRLIAEIGRLTGHPARVVPQVLDRPLCSVVDRLFRLSTGSVLSPSLARPAYYPHAKAARMLGYAPRFRLPEAFADMARSKKASPGLTVSEGA